MQIITSWIRGLILADHSFFDLRQRFLDQFEPARDGYLYRKHAVGAAIQVSQAERDGYVAHFDKFQKYGKWGIGGGFVLLVCAFAIYAVIYKTDPPDIGFYCGLGLIATAYMGYHFWVWSLPQRELRSRGTASPPLTRAEARRQELTKLSYQHIVGAVVIGNGPLIKIIISKKDVFSGWNLYWLILGVLVVFFGAFAAIQKWRLDMRSYPHDNRA